jgi:hypothetical protein
MADNHLAQAQRLVDQLTPHDQVRLLAYLTTRLAQVVTALPPTPGGTPPEPSDVWETFFQLGEMLAATEVPLFRHVTRRSIHVCRPQPVPAEVGNWLSDGSHLC